MAKTKISRFFVHKLFILLCIISSIYLIHKLLLLGPIEPFIRYVIIGFIILIDIFFLICLFKKNRKKMLISIVTALLSIIYVVAGYNIAKVYSIIDNMNKEYVTYSSSLITLKENNYTMNNLEGLKIGMLDNKESIDGYILPTEIIEEYKLKDKVTIKEYETYMGLIVDLYNKKIDLIFLQGNYMDIYADNEDYPTLYEDTKILVTKNKDKTKESANLLGDGKAITEPFTILLMGIDSTVDGLKNADSFNGDSLILVTFNPTDLNVTMLSIPRDSYVPITCFPGKIENKITHAAQMGSKCVMDTIENFTGIKIDYYMKINFTGLVELVDAVGGIDIDVPYNLCEQDSKRRFGNHMIYVEKGMHHLNGEQALALSRNRKKNEGYCAKKWTSEDRDDYSRSQNQQAVIKAIIDRAKNISSVNQAYDILNAISKNIDTNMSTSTILSFYNIAKDILSRSKSSTELVTIESLILDGTGQIIYDERSGLDMWNHIINEESLKDVIKEMKINLGIIPHTMEKTFAFSITEDYVSPKVGAGPHKLYTTYDLLPDLTNYTKEKAETWAKKYDITIKWVEVTSGGAKGEIIKQDYPVLKRLDKIDNRTVTLTIVKEGTTTTSKIDCTTKDNEDNKKCLLPNLVGLPKAYITTWGAQFSNNISVQYLEEESDKEKGTIIEQSIKSGTHLKDILEENTKIIITISKGNNTSTPVDPLLPEEEEDE